jgi:hypothetical protein
LRPGRQRRPRPAPPAGIVPAPAGPPLTVAAPEAPDGWLLDITESPDGRSVVLWTKDRRSGGVHRTAVEYRPPFLVDGARSDLAELARDLAGRSAVARVRRVVLRPSVFEYPDDRGLSSVDSLRGNGWVGTW